jgi:putative oxidoreductase
LDGFYGKEDQMFKRELFLNFSGPTSVILIRFMVGGVFLSEGIQKFLFPDALGVGRFIKIGIPSPELMAPFVGIVEIVCGLLMILGLATKMAAIPLLINISVAILTTKIPLLAKSGFWSTIHEARTDYCMFLGLLFLIIAGGGNASLDAQIHIARDSRRVQGRGWRP